jgi:alkylation response protein AidB-like acyl-CoA dehydrogenase
MPNLKSRLEELLDAGALDLPLPGGGDTARRHQMLVEFGAAGLSLARLAEAHTGALATLAEGGRLPRPGLLYGVWASDAPPGRVTCEQLEEGNWRIKGTKQFCSGATLVGAALVTAQHGSGAQLFDIPIDGTSVKPQPSTWVNPAFADTGTTAVRFDSIVVPSHCHIGGAGWYLNRAGFWHGAIGPAACWAGGASSLVEAATRLKRKDPHSRAQLGALQASAWGLRALLDQAGREIDEDPRDTSQTARTRALKVRHLIERTCTDVLDRFGRATGQRLLGSDPQVIAQHAALTLYIRQSHAERDLETIPS